MPAVSGRSDDRQSSSPFIAAIVPLHSWPEPERRLAMNPLPSRRGRLSAYVVLAGLLLLLLSGCSARETRTATLEVDPPAPDVPISSNVPLRVTFDKTPDTQVVYLWTIQGDKTDQDVGNVLTQTETSRFARYQAPATPGSVRILVRVMNGNAQVADASLTLKIVAPTPTPAGAAAAQPTAAPASVTTPAATTATIAATQSGVTITAGQPVITITPAGGQVASTPSWCAPFRRPAIAPAQLEGSATITAPTQCSDNDYITVVRGTYENVPDGNDIWVMVYPNALRYYPQSDDAAVPLKVEKKDGKWSIQIYLGTPTSGREVFDVVVVLADPAASKVIADTIKQWVQDNRFPGLAPDQLPAGIRELQAITIQRPR
jgi:hypothetical protein